MIARLFWCLAIGCLSLSTASFNLPSVAVRNYAVTKDNVGGGSRNRCLFPKQQFSLQERSHRMSSTQRGLAFVDPSSLIAAVGSFYENERWASAFVTCALKGAVADLMAQRANNSSKRSNLKAAGGEQISSEGSTFRGGSDGAVLAAEAQTPSLDIKRNLAFLLYGGIYQGMGLELIYNILFPRWFGESLVLKVFASMFILTPFVTLPVAYIVKACVFGESLKTAFANYVADVVQKGLLTKFWMIWIPMQTIAFAFVPEHLRISFIAAISFLWMILFSAISSNK